MYVLSYVLSLLLWVIINIRTSSSSINIIVMFLELQLLSWLSLVGVVFDTLNHV